MNALLRKALGLLALMMIAGMAYIATTSHGSQATLPALSLDEFNSKLGQRCQYASFKVYPYIGLSRAGGPTYLWNRNNDKVLIISGTDSILLNTRTHTAQRKNQLTPELSKEWVATLTKNWQLDQLACIGIYSHLMDADDRSFITANGNSRLRAQINDNTNRGFRDLVWEISPNYDPLSCQTTLDGDSVKISWPQWSYSPDSIRWASVAQINNQKVFYSNVKALQQLPKTGIMEDF